MAQTSNLTQWLLAAEEFLSASPTSLEMLVLPGPVEHRDSPNVPALLLVQSLLLLLSRFSHVRLCATPEMAAHQAHPSLGFSRQEHWSGLPFPLGQIPADA